MPTKTVLFISKSEQAASTRYRALNYFQLLKQAGWIPIHMKASGSFLDRVKCLNMARKADVVVVVRRTYDSLFRHLLRKAARRLVFDFDDAIYLNQKDPDNQKRLHQFQAMISHCDWVWAGNPHLASQANGHCANVHVMPTSVNATRYDVQSEKPGNHIDLVWIGSTSTKSYLQNIMPDLEEAARQRPDLRLKIIADFSLSSSVLNIQPIAWSQQTEVADLTSSHIGLAPLTDDPWTQGKCGLKVLQYMASRLPVISSRAGVNQTIVGHELTGLLVGPELSWQQAILKLADDATLRKAMGQAGRQRVLDAYDQARVGADMVMHLNALMSR